MKISLKTLSRCNKIVPGHHLCGAVVPFWSKIELQIINQNMLHRYRTLKIQTNFKIAWLIWKLRLPDMGHVKWHMWHVKFDTWHLTPDIWHLTPDTWHLTNDLFFSKNKIFFSSMSISVRFDIVVTIRTCQEIQCILQGVVMGDFSVKVSAS